MTKLLAAALALGLAGWSFGASADCPGHLQSVKKEQTVVEQLPITPAPGTKTGG